MVCVIGRARGVTNCCVIYNVPGYVERRGGTGSTYLAMHRASFRAEDLRLLDTSYINAGLNHPQLA